MLNFVKNFMNDYQIIVQPLRTRSNTKMNIDGFNRVHP